jgi:hypothetical protein
VWHRITRLARGLVPNRIASAGSLRAAFLAQPHHLGAKVEQFAVSVEKLDRGEGGEPFPTVSRENRTEVCPGRSVARSSFATRAMGVRL